MRAGGKELTKYFKDKLLIDSVRGGAWGMVLAPDSYYNKNKGMAEGAYEAACKLCDYMGKRAEARIIIASINIDQDEVKIEYKAGYWPK